MNTRYQKNNAVTHLTRRSQVSSYLAAALSIVLMTGCATSILSVTPTPTLATVVIQATDSPAEAVRLPRYRGNTNSALDGFVQEVYTLARRMVEQKTGARLQHVKLDVVDNRVIQQEVERETRRLVESQFTNRAYAEKFLQQLVNDQASSYIALYTDRGTRILLNRPVLKSYIQILEKDNTLIANALTALLIHELVHAADDQKYQIGKNRVMSFKASFTQSAAFEGHAQLVTRQICTLHQCLSGLDALERFMFAPLTATDPVTQGVQAISRNVLEYSYIEGERFLTSLSQRPNGEALIDAVLRRPPEDPIQVLVPNTYPNLQRQARNRRLNQAITRSQHLWTRPPWKIVETSPIKGINVRNNPEDRSAAVEGFTQLISAMESAQIYNQSGQTLVPIDLTLLEAENKQTAMMFAESFLLHATAGRNSPETVITPLIINSGALAKQLVTGSVTMLKPATVTDNQVLVATAGRYVLQLSGPANLPEDDWLEFTTAVIRTLHQGN